MPKGIRKLEKSNFMILLHMYINKENFPNRIVDGSIWHMIGLSIRFNIFRNKRTNRNWTLCICSHVSGNV